MAVHPLLFFPAPVVQPPARRGGGGGKVKTPTAEEQHARLDAKFQNIAKSFAGIQTTAQGFEPEQVIVFETSRHFGRGARQSGIDGSWSGVACRDRS